MTHLYLNHGLVLALPFLCEELEPVSRALPPDIRVTEGTVPTALEAPIVRDATLDASPNAFLFRGGERSARFLVENGCSITFQKNKGCEESLFFHHLLYPVMAAVLRQRELLVLHASCAISPRGAVLITGESGAGKSTTLAGLVARGWPMQTDDVSALRINGDGKLEILPGSNRIHLHEDAAAALPFDTDGLVRHDWHRMKMAVPAPLSTERNPCAVRRIVYLSRSSANDLKVETVKGRDKLLFLLRSIYGPFLAEQAWARYDLLAAALAEIEMMSIARPDGQSTLDAVIEAISHE